MAAAAAREIAPRLTDPLENHHQQSLSINGCHFLGPTRVATPPEDRRSRKLPSHAVAYAAAVRAEMTHEPQATDSAGRVASQVDDQACTFELRNCAADVARHVDSQHAGEHADAHVAYPKPKPLTSLAFAKASLAAEWRLVAVAPSDLRDARLGAGRLEIDRQERHGGLSDDASRSVRPR
jgi:hypothetical protein